MLKHRRAKSIVTANLKPLFCNIAAMVSYHLNHCQTLKSSFIVQGAFLISPNCTIYFSSVVDQ